jgi:excisionase family DNA binding protein
MNVFTDTLMTYKDLAAYLKCSEGKLRQSVMNRKIPFIKIGGSVRFDKSIIDDFLKQNTFIPRRTA